MIPTIGKASVFDTTDRIPASRACFSKSALACCVNITTGTAGAISSSRLAVSIPLIPASENGIYHDVRPHVLEHFHRRHSIRSFSGYFPVGICLQYGAESLPDKLAIVYDQESSAHFQPFAASAGTWTTAGGGSAGRRRPYEA